MIETTEISDKKLKTRIYVGQGLFSRQVFSTKNPEDYERKYAKVLGPYKTKALAEVAASERVIAGVR